MLAQRTAAWGAQIDALDIDEDCCRQAFENADHSPWGARIAVIHRSLQAYASKHRASTSALTEWAARPARYDHIVANPPYFSSNLKPASQARQLARHTDSLPLDELAEAVSQLLAEEGKFSLILPTDEAREFRGHAVAHGLLLSRQTEVATKPGSAPRRMLMEFARTLDGPLTADALVVGDERYVALTNEFYL